MTARYKPDFLKILLRRRADLPENVAFCRISATIEGRLHRSGPRFSGLPDRDFERRRVHHDENRHYLRLLGAGKTTLIKKLLEEAYQGEQVVLIENEFGEIGIDGGFLKEAGINITEMNSGCICCSLVGDFGRALHDVIEQFHPDRVIIEPSGVGKLSDVIRAVQRAAEETPMALNSFITVADATKCKMYMKNFGEFFNNQIEHATPSSSPAPEYERGEDGRRGGTAARAQRRRHHHHHPLGTRSPARRSSKPWRPTSTTWWAQLLHEEFEDEDECDDPECACHDHHHHDHEHAHDHEHHHHDHEHDHDHEHAHEHHHDHDHHEHHHHHHADEVFTSWGVETAPRKFTEEEISAALAALDKRRIRRHPAGQGHRARCGRRLDPLRLCAYRARYPPRRRGGHGPAVRHRRGAEGGRRGRPVPCVKTGGNHGDSCLSDRRLPGGRQDRILINGILEDGFAREDATLLLCCEEGIEEYDPRFLRNVTVVNIEDESQLSRNKLKQLEQKYQPKQILIEYNGMWEIQKLYFDDLPSNWLLYQVMTFVDSTTFNLYVKNMGALMMKSCGTRT